MMTKTKIAALLLALLVLGWCTQQAPATTSLPPSPAESEQHPQAIQDEMQREAHQPEGLPGAYEAEKSGLQFDPNFDGMPGNSGYYILLERGESTSVLTFLDPARGTMRALCEDTECLHNSTDCTAYVPFTGGSRVIATNDALYQVFMGQYSEDGVHAPRVDRLDFDGGNRTTLHTGEEGTRIWPEGFVYADDVLYFVLNDLAQLGDGVGPWTLHAMDLRTGEVDLIRPFSHDERLVAAKDDYLIIEEVVSPASSDIEGFGDPDYIQLKFSVLYRDGRELASPVTLSLREEIGRAMGGAYIAADRATGTVACYDFVTGDKKALFEQALPVEELEEFFVLTPKTESIFTVDTYSGDIQTTYVFDMLHGRWKLEQLTMPGYAMPVHTLAQFGDALLVNVNAELVEDSRTSPADGSVFPFTRLVREYGIFLAEDYWNNRSEYVPITNMVPPAPPAEAGL